MTRQELKQNVSCTTGVDQAVVDMVLLAAISEVKEAVESGEEVTLRGFGRFYLNTYAQKKGRNISKGKTVVVPERKLPKFKMAMSWKRELLGSKSAGSKKASAKARF